MVGAKPTAIIPDTVPARDMPDAGKAEAATGSPATSASGSTDVPRLDQQTATQPLRPSLAYVLSDAVTRAGARRLGTTERHEAIEDAAHARAKADHGETSAFHTGRPVCADMTVIPPPPASTENAPADAVRISSRSAPRSGVGYRVGLILCITLLALSVVMNVSLLRRSPPATTNTDQHSSNRSKATATAGIRAGRATSATAGAIEASGSAPVAANAKPLATVSSAPGHVPEGTTAESVAAELQGAAAPHIIASNAEAHSETVIMQPNPAAAANGGVVTSPERASSSATLTSPPATKLVQPAVSKIEAKALVSRGDALLADGDVTSARLFYRRAADGGDGAAALRLAETFDPGFLQQAGLSRIANDPNQALHWYRRAHDLGNSNADPLLKVFEPDRR